MFTIKYKLSERSSTVVEDADEVDLRYNLFLGSIELIHNDKFIIMDWGWIPVLDFALGMLFLSKSLLDKINGMEVFEFTESNEKIAFSRLENDVKISSTFSNEIITVDFKEFYKTVQEFHREVLLDILNKNPELKVNSTFVEYLNEII